MAIVHQYLGHSDFPEACLFTSCNCTRGGSWEKQCENASVMKVTCSTFKKIDEKDFKSVLLLHDWDELNLLAFY